MASSTSPGAGVASYVGTLFSINATEAGPKDPLAEDQFEIRESCELNFFLNNLYDVGFCCLKTCGEGGWIVAPFSGGGVEDSLLHCLLFLLLFLHNTHLYLHNHLHQHVGMTQMFRHDCIHDGGDLYCIKNNPQLKFPSCN